MNQKEPVVAGMSQIQGVNVIQTEGVPVVERTYEKAPQIIRHEEKSES